LVAGFFVGLIFGAMKPALAWLDAPEDDTPWALLRILSR
jgi:hypothetical protein